MAPPPMKAVQAPIDLELLEYCKPPEDIAPTFFENENVQDGLQRVLNVVINNHSVYAECYVKQRGLVDAVKIRQ